ncbi:hypothetical protein [Cognatitamlana onchidii]|uniref:hypothetical protein n=1 Tax=Cognatitamlana onchidii TaxID=2562860 RepID=UPI0010A6B476|nr:hypothetical protein [Algibacter onchidii]
MEKLSLNNYNRVLLATFFNLAALSGIAIFIKDKGLFVAVKSLSIPVFLLFFFVKNYRIKIPLMLFLVFTFLSDNANIIFYKFSVVGAESTLYCLAFTQLIAAILPDFKFFRLDNVIKAYLFLILCVVLFFFKLLYDMVGLNTQLSALELILFFARCLSVLFLVFMAFGAYLQNQTKKSIMFFIAAVCFGFSGVIDYISLSFIGNASTFILFNRVIYLLGVFFIFKFIIEENELNNRSRSVHEQYFSEDNIWV